MPKTGGTVVGGRLRNKFKQTLYSGPRNYILPKPYNTTSLQHQYYTTLYKYRNLLNINFNNIKIFTIVRNPYDRIISDLFFYSLIKKEDNSDKVFKIIKNNYIVKMFDNHNKLFPLVSLPVAVAPPRPPPPRFFSFFRHWPHVLKP